MVQLTDTLVLDQSARICADGSLVAEVFAARTGLQDYRGYEVDPSGARFGADKIVKVYRPESEVFKADSLASFAAAPVTLDHPSTPVTADNWRAHGVGEINGDIVRDGQRVRVPIIVRDAAAVRAATSTHKQLSMGYATELVFPADGKHPDGTACDAYQTNLKINHIALVKAARGGPELRVVDERAPKENPVKKIVLDGLQVDLADADAVAAAISKLQDKAAQAATALTDANAKLATETGKTAALEAQLADANAKLAPAAIDKLVADRAALVSQAKAIVTDLDVTGKTDAEIRRAVVTARLGDKCPADDAAVSGAFAVLAGDAAAKPAVQNIGAATAIGDSAAAIRAIRAARYA
jgi:hypothetical protein